MKIPEIKLVTDMQVRKGFVEKLEISLNQYLKNISEVEIGEAEAYYLKELENGKAISALLPSGFKTEEFYIDEDWENYIWKQDEAIVTTLKVFMTEKVALERIMEEQNLNASSELKIQIVINQKPWRKESGNCVIKTKISFGK